MSAFTRRVFPCHSRSFGLWPLSVPEFHGFLLQPLGAVFGQIAGAYYGFDAIPDRWVKAVKTWEKVNALIERFMDAAPRPNPRRWSGKRGTGNGERGTVNGAFHPLSPLPFPNLKTKQKGTNNDYSQIHCRGECARLGALESCAPLARRLCA